MISICTKGIHPLLCFLNPTATGFIPENIKELVKLDKSFSAAGLHLRGLTHQWIAVIHLKGKSNASSRVSCHCQSKLLPSVRFFFFHLKTWTGKRFHVWKIRPLFSARFKFSEISMRTSSRANELSIGIALEGLFASSRPLPAATSVRNRSRTLRPQISNMMALSSRLHATKSWTQFPCSVSALTRWRRYLK